MMKQSFEKHIFPWQSRLSQGVSLIKSGENQVFSLYKGPGIMSHPNSKFSSDKRIPLGHSSNSIVKSATFDPVQEAFFATNLETHDKFSELEKSPLRLLNRLDSATSGIILVSTNKCSTDAIKLAFKKRKDVKKKYIALVFSKRPNIQSSSDIVWEDDMIVDNLNNQIRARSLSSRENKVVEYMTAVTSMTILKYACQHNPLGLMLLELHPHTGYSHQLRMQCAKHGYPIVGDKIYGDFDLSKRFYETYGSEISNRLYLHSVGINVKYTINHRTFTFECESEIPKDFLYHQFDNFK